MDILYSAVELLFISLSRDPGPAAAAKTRPFFFFAGQCFRIFSEPFHEPSSAVPTEFYD